MAKQKNDFEGKAKKIIGIYLDELLSPERYENAPLNQISSALGTLIDKFCDKSDTDNGILPDRLKAMKGGGQRDNERKAKKSD